MVIGARSLAYRRQRRGLCAGRFPFCQRGNPERRAVADHFGGGGFSVRGNGLGHVSHHSRCFVEGHLWGAVSGVVLALYYRKYIIRRDKFDWEEETEQEQEQEEEAENRQSHPEIAEERITTKTDDSGKNEKKKKSFLLKNRSLVLTNPGMSVTPENFMVKTTFDFRGILQKTRTIDSTLTLFGTRHIM
jgi:hypothetical protein